MLQPELRHPAPEMGRRAIRTRNLILVTAKQLYLERGYNGASISDITKACGISNASFYTYFGSKRDVFLVLGADCFKAMDHVLSDFVKLVEDWSEVTLEAWVLDYMTFMDEHGGFIGAWAEASYNDAELKASAQASEIHEARRVGRAVKNVSGYDGDSVSLGLAVLGLLDRFWYVWHVYGFPVERDDALKTLTHALAALLTPRTDLSFQARGKR